MSIARATSSQYLYSLWHHQVDSAGTINPNVQYDVSYLIAAAALPAYDQSYGVSNTAVQTNYNKLNPSISTGFGSTGPMGTAEVMPDMPGTGGRPDIGTQPNWVAQWLLSQNSTAETVMMANADASGGVPWHLVDENTGTLVHERGLPVFLARPAQCRRHHSGRRSRSTGGPATGQTVILGSRHGAHARSELRSLFDYRRPVST